MNASKEADPPMDRILRAVCRGARSLPRIAKRARVTEALARTYLHRLKAQGLIFTKPAKGLSRRKGHRGSVKGDVLKLYYHAQVEVLLLDIWRTHANDTKSEEKTRAVRSGGSGSLAQTSAVP